MNNAFDANDVPTPRAEDNTLHESSFLTSISPPRRTPRRRMAPAPTHQAAVTGEVIKSVKHHSRRPQPPDDRYDILGKKVARVLRYVLEPQRCLAETFINDVLFSAQMGNLTTSHALIKVPELSLLQHYEGPPTVHSENTEKNNNVFDADNVPTLRVENDTPHESSFLTSSRSRLTLGRMASTHQAALTGEVILSVNDYSRRPQPPDDGYDIFSQKVTNVLRYVLEPQRCLAKTFINDVLVSAQMGNLTTSHALTKMPKLPLPQHNEGPPTVQRASPNSTAVTNPTTMPQQEERQPQKPPVCHQLIQCTGSPNELSQLNDSTETVTVSQLDSTFCPEDVQ